MTHPEWLGTRARMVLRGLVPRSARRAARVLALSHTAAGDLAQALGIEPGKVRVVSPYADPVFTPAEGAAERVAGRFGLERYCLAVGDLGPRKNLASLGAAVRSLGDRPGAGPGGQARPRRGADRPRVGRALAGPRGRRRAGRPLPRRRGDRLPLALRGLRPAGGGGDGLRLPGGGQRPRRDLPEVAGGAAILVEPSPRGIAEGLREALHPETAARLRAAGPVRAAHYSAQAMGTAAWAAVMEVVG